jgi:hypothetical protein
LFESAKWFDLNLKEIILKLFKLHPDYTLDIIGHSLGAGVASILGLFWKTEMEYLKCFCFACPCTLSKELSIACSPFVYSLVNGNDFASRLSDKSIELLRREVSINNISFFEKGIGIYKSFFYSPEILQENVFLYPSGIIYSIKEWNEKIFIFEDDLLNFEKLVLGKSSIEDHRFYNYERLLNEYVDMV